MGDSKALKAGDPCPQCGSDFVVDPMQEPHRLIERKRRNAASPSVADRFAESVREKVAEHGVIHLCPGCGYTARFHPRKKAA